MGRHAGTAPVTLTLSGNEITDARRTAALAWTTAQQGGSTDGLTPPAGVAVWQAGTNLFRRGQCDAVTDWGTTGTGSPTRTIDATTPPPFSTQSMKYVTSGASGNEGCMAVTATGQAAAAGALGTGSIYFKGIAGNSYDFFLRWLNTDASTTAGATLTITATGNWQLISPASIAVAVGKTGDQLQIFARINSTRNDTFWVAHAMLQWATGVLVGSPYVATSGGAVATRAAARVQAPFATLLTEPQGWLAMRVRMGWASTTVPDVNQTDFMAALSGDTQNEIRCACYFHGNSWELSNTRNSVEAHVQINDAFSVGDLRTVIWAWTNTQLALSVAGSVFSTAARGAAGGTALGTNLDIGSQGNGHFCDSNMLWAVFGKGVLTNADAAAIAALGAPLNNLLAFPPSSQPTMLWPALTGTAAGGPVSPSAVDSFSPGSFIPGSFRPVQKA